MKPLFLADWAYINRLFRAAMWLVALALVGVIVAFASPHASQKQAPTRPAPAAHWSAHSAAAAGVAPRR
ncbi:MAG TPA: hypothetical protein VGL51_07415 [Solirubrobacteraceae bacterium]|jgi:hypothetical protein